MSASWPCMAVPPDGSDARHIGYALHLALGRADARVARISAIDNPLARHQFSRRTSGVLKLHCFVGGGEDGGAVVQDWRLRWAAARSGGGSSGVGVHIGGVPADVLEGSAAAAAASHSGASGDDAPRRGSLVYCLAAVGQAWPVDAATLARCRAQSSGVPPPAGYDSFVLGEPADAAVEGAGDAWRHRWIDSPDAAASQQCMSEYWLADSSQVLPLYVVEFELPAAAGGGSPSAGLGQTCEPGQCQYHACPCEYYCPRCQSAMCAECKLTGHHSHGPALAHVLQPLTTAYRTAVQNCQDGANPMLIGAVANLDAARESVRARGAAVQENAAECRRALAAMMEAMNAQIDHAENCRLAALQSQEVELVRQLRTLSAGEEFLRSQADELPMAAFMQTWATHVHSRTPMLSEGAPDLLVAGAVDGGGGGAGVMGFDAHEHGTPAHGADASLGSLSLSGGSSLVSFASPSPQANTHGSSSGMGATPHSATAASSAVAMALADVSPLPSLVLHGAVGLKVATPGDCPEHQPAGAAAGAMAAAAMAAAATATADPWWQPPGTVDAATRAARAAASSGGGGQFLPPDPQDERSSSRGGGGGGGGGGVQWGWCSEPQGGNSRTKERAARLRQALRGAAMAGGGAAAALMGSDHVGGVHSNGASLSRSAAVVVGQTTTLARGNVESLQSVKVLVRDAASTSVVRLEIRHADAISGGLGMEFGEYDLPYRYPSACTIDMRALRITKVVTGSVASLRPDLRVGSIIIGVNGQPVNKMTAAEVYAQLEAAEAAAVLETDGEIDDMILLLDVLHERSAPAMPPLSPQAQTQTARVVMNEPGGQTRKLAEPAPPPPFQARVAAQLDDVLGDVIEKEENSAAVRIQAAYRGGAQRVDYRVACLAATMVQARFRGARARREIAAHRAALFTEEERERQAQREALPELEEEEEEEEEPVDMVFKQQHVEMTPTAGDEEDDGDDEEGLLAGLGAKLPKIERVESMPATPETNTSLAKTPRTIAKQLKVCSHFMSRQLNLWWGLLPCQAHFLSTCPDCARVCVFGLQEDELELDEVEARIEALASATKPPPPSPPAEAPEQEPTDTDSAPASAAEIFVDEPPVSPAQTSPAATAASPSPKLSPRALSTLSANAEANAVDEVHRTAPSSGSKARWGVLKQQVKRPAGESLLQRMQAVAKQAEEANSKAREVTTASKARPEVTADVAMEEGGEAAVAVDEIVLDAAPTRPPRPSRDGSKSRLALNRERLLNTAD